MRNFHACLLSVSLLLSLNGCERPSSQPERVVKIGTVLGLTGDNAAYGIRMRQGLELAVEQANATDQGTGIRFELVVEDSQWEPRLGVSAYRKMHDFQGIQHYAAICGSKIALAVCEASRQDEIVIVDAISGAPKLTAASGPKYFRVYASDAMAGQRNVAWALRDGARSFAVVYVEDDWGASYKDAIVQVLQEQGIQAPLVPITLGTRDFKTEAQKIMSQNPDALFVVLYANLALPLVRELRTLGFSGTFYGGDNLSSSDFSAGGPEIIEGVRLSLPAEPESEKYAEFDHAFQAKFGEAPDSFALKSFDALMLLTHAIRATDGTPTSVIQYLRDTPGYEGASGRLSFDQNGDLREQDYQGMIYRAGQLTPFGDK